MMLLLFFLLFLLANRQVYTESELLATICQIKDLNFSQGESYQYSNTGYFLLGLLIKRVHFTYKNKFTNKLLTTKKMITNQFDSIHKLF